MSPIENKVDGVELVSKKRGFILTKNGRQLQRNLPIQRTSTNTPLMGMRIDASPVDATLPTKIWKQYGQVRVLYKRLDIFYEIRDNQIDGSVTMIFGLLIYPTLNLVLLL